ncbi:hypothetical protein Tco_0615957 [Tanacetum coccineum]
MQTQREAQQANELSNLTRQRQLLASVNNRRAIIEELERLPRNFVACKTTEHLKRIQKAIFVEVIDLKKELRLQSPTCVNFLRWYDPPMCQRSVQIILGLLRSRNELEEIVAMVEEKRRKRAIIEELECLPGNLVACKTREHLKRIQKVVFVEVIELKKELRLQVPP